MKSRTMFLLAPILLALLAVEMVAQSNRTIITTPPQGGGQSSIIIRQNGRTTQIDSTNSSFTFVGDSVLIISNASNGNRTVIVNATSLNGVNGISGQNLTITSDPSDPSKNVIVMAAPGTMKMITGIPSANGQMEGEGGARGFSLRDIDIPVGENSVNNLNRGNAQVFYYGGQPMNIDYRTTVSYYPPVLYPGDNVVTFEKKEGIASIRYVPAAGEEWMVETVRGPEGVKAGPKMNFHVRVNTAAQPIRGHFEVTDVNGKAERVFLPLNQIWTLDENHLPDVAMGSETCAPFRISIGGGTSILDSITTPMAGASIRTGNGAPPLEISGWQRYIYTVCFRADGGSEQIKPGIYRFPVITWMRRDYPNGGYTTYPVADTAVVRVLEKENRLMEISKNTATEAPGINEMPMVVERKEPVKEIDPVTTAPVVATPGGSDPANPAPSTTTSEGTKGEENGAASAWPASLE